MMREWASENGVAVRQRRARLYGKNWYRTRDLLSRELPPSVTKECNGAIDSEQESMESETDNTDEMLEIGNEVTFLLGPNSPFSRSIKFNRKFF